MKMRTFMVVGLLLGGSCCLVWVYRPARPSEPVATVVSDQASGSGVQAAKSVAAQVISSADAAPAPLDAAPPTPAMRGMVAEWSGPAPVSLRQAGEQRRVSGDAAPARLPIRLGPGREGVMLVRGFTVTSSGGGVFTGELENHAGSTVVLGYEGDAVAGVVLLPAEHRAFNYRAGDDGMWRVTELDTSQAPQCGQPDAPLFPPRI